MNCNQSWETCVNQAVKLVVCTEMGIRLNHLLELPLVMLELIEVSCCCCSGPDKEGSSVCYLLFRGLKSRRNYSSWSEWWSYRSWQLAVVEKLHGQEIGDGG